MIRIYNQNNLAFSMNQLSDVGIKMADVIFADCIYESLDFYWANWYWDMLHPNGLFYIITDFHTVSEIDMHMKTFVGAKRINKLVWKNEWGKPPSSKFHECYDEILIYAKGNYKFDGSKVQVPKATAKSKGLNPSGRTTKNATAWIDNITLTTSSLERIKQDDGRLVRWQKPEALVERLLLPYVKKGSVVLDPFMGSGTAGVVCANNGWHYIGIEIGKKEFKLAEKRLKDRITDDGYIPF